MKLLSSRRSRGADMTVRVTADVFDSGAELSRFEAKQSTAVGAVVSFLGRVRDDQDLADITLEHYQAMAERELTKIVAEASTRWDLADVLVIHRYGCLKPGAPIVFVATAAQHRQAAFDAANFLMDYLKTRAPFWKKETRADRTTWVDAKTSDDDAANKWSS